MRPVWMLALAGCVFEPPEAIIIASDDDASEVDAGEEGRDSSLDAVENIVPHLPRSQWFVGTEDLILGSVEIDTSVPEIQDVDLPLGVIFELSGQTELDAPEVAVLHVRDLIVPKTSIVRVKGSRPLIVIAGRDVRIDGVLDGSARGIDPGPGGHLPGEGAGRGAGGPSLDTVTDLGGGGGGFGTAGGPGGSRDDDPGGAGGAISGDDVLSILRGGSGGGSGGSELCTRARGGGGGGAIQIHAVSLIEIEGAIDVGGGGGEGGVYCNLIDAAAGGGGGAGGAIHLEADRVRIVGSLAANGGGGGGAGSGGIDPMTEPGGGQAGEDGRVELPALGGPAGGPRGTPGGTGSFKSAGDAGAPRLNAGNTGGGGGGGGRILVRAREPILEGSIVPPPVVATP